MSFISTLDNQLSIRSFKQNDLPSLLKLYQSVWPRRGVNEAYWLWKYEHNPFGDPLLVLAIQDGKVVGHEGLWPTPLLIKGEEKIGFQSVDSMVDESYRGRGIFNKLISRSMELCNDTDCSLVFGFPNRNSAGVYQKFGWITGEVFHRYVKVLNWQDVFLSRFENTLLQWPASIFGKACNKYGNWFHNKAKDNSFDIQEHLEPLPIFADTWREYYDQQGQPLSIHKNYLYFKWRYKNKPDSTYIYLTFHNHNILVGFGIIKSDNSKVLKRARIGELVIIDEASTKKVIVNLIRFLENQGFSTIEYNVWLNYKLENVLKQLGFIRRPIDLPIIYKTFKQVLYTDCNWHLSSGDNESF